MSKRGLTPAGAEIVEALTDFHQTLKEGGAEAAAGNKAASGHLYRMTLAEFHLVNGHLCDERVELLDGILIKRAGERTPREVTVSMLLEADLTKLLPAGWYVRSRHPLSLPPQSELEPELSVVRGNARDYAERHPGPADTAIVVEFKKWGKDLDRGLERVYAAAGIPIYWVIDTAACVVIGHSKPGPNGYAESHNWMVFPVTIEGETIGRIGFPDISPERDS